MKENGRNATKSVENEDRASRHIHTRRRRTMLSQIFGRLLENKPAMAGLAILFVIILLSFVVPPFSKYGVNDMDLAIRFKPPSMEHPFGTDAYGRDCFIRVIYGARYSLLLGLSAAIFGLVVGVLLGLIDGYMGGNFDVVFMRFIDIIASIPGTLLAILISTLLGGGLFNTIIALSIGEVPITVRLIRAQILSVRGEEYIEAATLINAGPFRMMLKHILPNVISPVIVSTTMSIGGTITQAAALSYLGLGIQPPTPEWGAMLSSGKEFSMFYPWIMLYPGIAIALVVLSINLFGDGLRDAIDPKLKK